MTEYLQGRQAIYEYLYMAYYRIPDARFVELTKKFCGVFEALGAETGGDIATGAEILANFLKLNADTPDEKLAERLNIEFTKLFLIADHIKTTENGWRGSEKTKAEIILSVSDYFANAGITKPTEINVPIDSYSMELFYLYQTSRAAARSEDTERAEIIEKQLAFAGDHILRWTDKFKYAILDKTTETSFYRSLAYLSAGFLRYDFPVSEEVSDVQEDNQTPK